MTPTNKQQLLRAPVSTQPRQDTFFDLLVKKSNTFSAMKSFVIASAIIAVTPLMLYPLYGFLFLNSYIDIFKALLNENDMTMDSAKVTYFKDLLNIVISQTTDVLSI